MGQASIYAAWAAVIVSLLNVAYFVKVRRDTVRRDELTTLRETDEKQWEAIVGTRERLIRAEAEIDDKPTATALHELAVSLTSCGGDIKAVVARLDGLETLVERIEKIADRQESYLMNKGRDR